MGVGTQGPGTQLDSQYGSSALGSGTHGTGMHGHQGHGHQGIGSNAYGSGTRAHGSSNINAGPHQSKLANKLDPRVDSDLGKVVNPTNGKRYANFITSPQTIEELMSVPLPQQRIQWAATALTTAHRAATT